MSFSDRDILDYLAVHPGARRQEIHRLVAPEVSDTTIWRTLGGLVDEGKLEVSGGARATGYALAGAAVIRAHLKMTRNRRRPAGYGRNFPDRYIPDTTFHLGATDRQRLQDAGRPDIPPLPAGTRARRILEHLLADLSRASPRMECDTCDILETERFIRFGREAVGKVRKEAVMILSQEKAIQHVVDTLDTVTISRPDLRNTHALLADGLLSDPGMTGQLRRMPVGITHSSYRPLSATGSRSKRNSASWLRGRPP